MKQIPKIKFYLTLCWGALIPCTDMVAETIKIAAIFAKSGIAGPSNVFQFEGVRFAIDELNRKGGLLGRKLKLLELNNKSSLIASKAMAKQAIKADVTAVVGSSWSSHSLAIAPLLQAAKIPMIATMSTNPNVTRVGNYIFRACFIDPFQGKVMARFAQRELHAKTAAILTDVRSDYSMGLARVFRENFIKTGGRVLLELEYKQKQKDFNKQLTRIKKAAPDVVYIPGHNESGFIVKQAQKLGVRAIPLGGDGWGGPTFLYNGGNTLKIGYFSNHWSKEVESKTSRSFLKNYEQRSEKPINAGIVLAYDAVMILAAAIRRAGSLERSKIRKALAKTKNFKTVSGKVTFNKDGDPIKTAVIMKIVNGGVHYSKLFSP